MVRGVMIVIASLVTISLHILVLLASIVNSYSLLYKKLLSRSIVTSIIYFMELQYSSVHQN
jgi:hypothetical protein